MDRYDVVIVGTGAGGGTLARHLAPSGKRILLLERGDWLPREPQNWDAAACSSTTATSPPDTWYDEHGKPFQPQVHYFVGGATKLYGAALYRLRPEDFGELRHHDGISPAWPITYDELEPYYTQAEQAYEVHGNRGEDPTEGPAERARTRSRPSRTSRASSSSRTRSSRTATARSTRRAASGSTRPNPRSAPACAARTATASRASCTASRTRTCSACGRRSSTRTSRC